MPGSGLWRSDTLSVKAGIVPEEIITRGSGEILRL
jgi:hypothetical protein